jgi:DNA-binding NarL/FixJ family response regulator
VRHVADLALGIVELHASGQPSSERLAEAARSCVTSEDTFEVVAAYRCCPDILPHLLDDDVVRPRLVEVLNEIDPALASAHGVLHPDASVRAASVEALSTREREVFDLLAEGLTNRQIAQRLFITEATAKLHVRHILAKLGARSRVEAVLLATE